MLGNLKRGLESLCGGSGAIPLRLDHDRPSGSSRINERQISSIDELCTGIDNVLPVNQSDPNGSNLDSRPSDALISRIQERGTMLHCGQRTGPQKGMLLIDKAAEAALMQRMSGSWL